MCFNLPCFVLGIPVSFGFKYAAGLNDRNFFLIYLASMLGCALFQLPAVAVLLSLDRDRTPREAVAARTSWAEQLRPYRDPEYRRMLAVTLLRTTPATVPWASMTTQANRRLHWPTWTRLYRKTKT